jgi:ketosteroid isomerase-like protein
MQAETSVAVAGAWQEAANAGDVERVLALSDPEIALVGPRGTARGHGVLREWLGRAGLRLTTRRLFARDGVVVAAQRGVWRSMETGEVVGEADVASCFRVADGRVVEAGRYDDLEVALGVGGLGEGDEVV